MSAGVVADGVVRELLEEVGKESFSNLTKEEYKTIAEKLKLQAREKFLADKQAALREMQAKKLN